ncbi:MAG TPA: rhodanese-like domain-containing protein [Vicinamibacterales bacterium]
MLHVLALVAATTTVEPLVSTDWLQAHLSDPQVRVVFTGDEGVYKRGHIPGARIVDHMDTIADNHRLKPFADLAQIWAHAGVTDGTHVVLYGDSPMTTGWLFLSLAAIGHGGDVSWLDGNLELWKREKRPVSTDTSKAVSGTLTVHPAPDIVVDAAYVREHLKAPDVKLLDVRTTQEWNAGHLPGAAFILWQDLFADRDTLKFKSPDEIRALLSKVGVEPSQTAVTYCAVGMRASLMYWAARTVGIPARVYVGSYSDWQRDSMNPIVR